MAGRILAAWGLLALASAVLLAVPVHAAQSSYLSVSSDVFYGPMILEVAVDDPVFANRGSAEPHVLFDGVKLAMTQTVDGVWRAYVAHVDFAIGTFDLTAIPGTGLDFGEVCTGAGFADFDHGVSVFASGPECNGLGGILSVVGDAGEAIGGAGNDYWPFIQALHIPGGVVPVEYRDGLVWVHFDPRLNHESHVELDRDSYPFDTPVHIEVHDVMLNIDPTTRDSWTFDREAYAARNVFGADGSMAGAAEGADHDLLYHDEQAMSAIGFGGLPDRDFGLFPEMGKRGNIVIRDNALQEPHPGTSRPSGLVTILETGPNTGVFANTDRFGRANVITPPDAGLGPDRLLVMYYDDYVRHVGLDAAGSPQDPGYLGAVLSEPEAAYPGGLYQAQMGQPVVISSTIGSASEEARNFAYVLEVADSAGNMVHRSWVTGQLDGNQSLDLAQSWTPVDLGLYTATAYLQEFLGAPPEQQLARSIDIPVRQ